MFNALIIFVIGCMNIAVMGIHFHQFMGILMGILCIAVSAYIVFSEKYMNRHNKTDIEKEGAGRS